MLNHVFFNYTPGYFLALNNKGKATCLHITNVDIIQLREVCWQFDLDNEASCSCPTRTLLRTITSKHAAGTMKLLPLWLAIHIRWGSQKQSWKKATANSFHKTAKNADWMQSLRLKLVHKGGLPVTVST